MTQNKSTNNKIHKYRKPLNLNIGMLIFCAILIYVIAFVVVSMRTEKTVPYEVREGSLAVNYTYRALALRDEQVVCANKSGYINYFAREGERVTLSNLIYTVDETGDLKEHIENNRLENSSLSKEELTELRSDMVNFVHGFDPHDFSRVYDFKYELSNRIMKLNNAYLTESIEDISNDAINRGIVNFCNAVNTGIITYYVDGYEDVKPDQLTMELFDESKYEKKLLLNNELVTTDEPVYKLSKDENWSLILPIEEALSSDFLDEEYIKVKFLKNQNKSWGKVSIITGADGKTYMQLDFNNSMITFAKDRFVDIELLLHDETGLKIPNSAIVNKEFYLIPKEYITVIGDDSDKGAILIEVYKEDGTISTDYTEIDLYSYDKENEYYYIDSVYLNSGVNLLKTDSHEKHTVSRKGTLMGVYYINKGYADFRQIQILYQNEEYAIVKSNTQYGLNVYDYVVLNAASVSDEQFIYK